ncbi:hypothetical protein TNCV_1660131 [Trichonephila clavipes]|nr:hypothetical protein TNCV_1660131 [Trichonephila clavipes]
MSLSICTAYIYDVSLPGCCGRGSLVVKVSDGGWHVTSSSTVPLKARRVGEGCTLNLLRAETSSRRSDMVVRRGGNYEEKLRGPSSKTLA